jgi:Ser/Thr protein kinase RdoA (MazF antagonist)
VLAPADAALVQRDPAVPGLAVLLDADALADLVGAPVRRDYLRYKPGTSCVLGGSAALPDGPVEVAVVAYAADSEPKTDKVLAAAPAGAVLAFSRTLGVVAARSAGDRDLPLLGLTDERRRKVVRRLLGDRPGLRDARVRTLSYKPMRRWVGVLEPRQGAPMLLRACRPADAETAVAAVRALEQVGPRTPRLLGYDAAHGLVVTEYLPGRPLDDLLRRSAAGPAELRAAGRSLAALHAVRAPSLPERTLDEDVAAVEAAAAQLAVLLPDTTDRVAALAGAVTARLSAAPRRCTAVHGDFSADQVLVRPDGSVALLDLDRAARADPAGDLAAFEVALFLGRLQGDAGDLDVDGVVQQVREGYRAVRALPDEASLAAHAAAQLLRRAAEPFRRCAPDWPAQTRALLDRVQQLAPLDPLAVPPLDLVAPLVGDPASLEVLKDKPRRRRTSRARGPHGTAIVKVYASPRAPVVAARVGALVGGPAEPVLPRVLLCDELRHVVVLTDVPGEPCRHALLAGDLTAAERIGAALAGWHAAHRGRVPAALRPHTVDREVAVLLARRATAPPGVGGKVDRLVEGLAVPWRPTTVVHRDLYEEQVLLGAQVGLLDLDDAAAGPAELDIGNLLAHLLLLGLRTRTDLDDVTDALLRAYTAVAPLDLARLRQCRALAMLRLACLHGEPVLADAAEADAARVIGCGAPGRGRAAARLG